MLSLSSFQVAFCSSSPSAGTGEATSTCGMAPSHLVLGSITTGMRNSLKESQVKRVFSLSRRRRWSVPSLLRSLNAQPRSEESDQPDGTTTTTTTTQTEEISLHHHDRQDMQRYDRLRETIRLGQCQISSMEVCSIRIAGPVVIQRGGEFVGRLCL